MNPLFDKPFTFDRVARIIFGLAAISGIIYLIAVLRNALLPFLIAWLLAYMMQPFVKFFQYKLKLKNRLLSIIAVIVSGLLLLSLIGVIIVPSVTQEVNKTMELFIIFVIFLYFIFILLDYERIANGWIRLIPERYRPFIQGLADDVEYSMNRYFRGQSLIALCVGILFAIGFKIVGFPLAVILGLFIGMLNLIPYLQTIGIIPMILLALLKSAETGQNFWVIFGLGLLVLAIVQVIQDLYLTPRIMGKAMGLNPAIILLSLSIWGTLLGFIGLIIALPLTTLFLSYYKRFILMEEEGPLSEKEKETKA